MQESLKLLISDIVPMGIETLLPMTDDMLLKEAKNINNLSKRENYLKMSLSKTSGDYWKSTVYLAKLLMKKEPVYAYNLLNKLSYRLKLEPYPYILISEIAIRHKAWLVAKSTLEVAQWLSCDENKAYINKVNKLLNYVRKKIASNEQDSSGNELWSGKPINKSIILLNILNAHPEEVFFKYSKRLLNIFPEDLENYDRIYQILYVLKEKEVVRRFAELINKNKNLNEEDKNLYLGISYYNLLELDNSVKYLEEVLKINNKNLNAHFYLALSYLISGNFDRFSQTFQKLLPDIAALKESVDEILQTSSPLFLGAFFIWSTVSDIDLILHKPSQEKDVSMETAKLIKEIYRKNGFAKIDNLLNQMKRNELFEILPDAPLYLSELFIEENCLEKAKELLMLSKSNETHRLYAWIYRLEKKENQAEEELIKYRKEKNQNNFKSLIFKMLRLALPGSAPGDKEQVFKMLEDAYLKAQNLKEKIALEYGLCSNTCFEAKCSECCKKTFPIISYTEYLYLRDWVEKQAIEFKDQIYDNSMKIVNSYREKYKKDPPFLSPLEAAENRLKYYPLDFQFECPALLEEQCSVYEAQPFICRVYGYSSHNRTSFMGCNFFNEQFKAATNLTPVRKVIDMLSFADFVKLTDKQLIGVNVVAPIPVWFAQDHEKALWKARGYRLSQGLFAPVFSFMTRLYYKMLDVKREREKSRGC
ncbi:MAG: hypothetical protein A3F80_03275 [Candidatus Melainabacteria bacterium RIFCSPLOWO2_12_FULL_35_11]|nr:MAG: hypothetical protein A3F80_03275 [Candidatus Melainabacteria bacterium RIFCSPLOWO2_12_FULL_35_11]